MTVHVYYLESEAPVRRTGRTNHEGANDIRISPSGVLEVLQDSKTVMAYAPGRWIEAEKFRD